MKKQLTIFLTLILNFAALNAANSYNLEQTTACKEAFERFPFGVIFSKTAPANLNAVSMDTDFCYFYFSPGLERCCDLRRSAMCTGTVNAKRDFPYPDYIQYFADDTAVMRNHADGSVKAFCEPWGPPGVTANSFIYTHKTAMQSEGKSYMLGCFELIDGLINGSTEFKQVPHDTTVSLPAMGAVVPDSWFIDAFDALPLGMAITREDGTVVCTNKLWEKAIAETDHPDMPMKEIMHELHEMFDGHRFPTDGTALLTSAAWIGGNATGNNYDFGTYGIRDSAGNPLQVIVVRPIMQDNADPYYLNGTLVPR